MTPYGTAPGAPGISTVANADGLVDLFNSASARAMGALSNPQDAGLFEGAKSVCKEIRGDPG